MPLSKIGKSRLTPPTSYANVDIAVVHRDRVRRGRDHRRQAGHLAGLQVEARAVLRALHVHAPQLAVRQRELLVGADVVERVEVAVFGVRKTYGDSGLPSGASRHLPAGGEE